ncbi:MAG: WG repeat-containing protein [Flavobacteriaceae bacterium]|nr:WG repeat-containing protein [Flavobacteriaceae bacterium]
MKRTAILLVAVILIPLLGFSQAIENIDYISPFNDGLSAIKKGNQWAFIDQEGSVVIDFRDDVMTSKIDNDNYPVFINGRCLIIQKKEGISYLGYIDKSGNTVIKPQFLNATNFNKNIAIVLELVKESRGFNDILKKPIVYYKYFEVVINTGGEIIHYLSDPIPVTLSKKFIRQPPKIRSKLISDNTFATWSKDKKWVIKKIEK